MELLQSPMITGWQSQVSSPCASNPLLPHVSAGKNTTHSHPTMVLPSLLVIFVLLGTYLSPSDCEPLRVFLIPIAPSSDTKDTSPGQ
jgi:hypothetical protein